MTAEIRYVQRLEKGRFCDLPGGTDYRDEHAAITAATVYAISSGDRTRVTKADGHPVWDSKFNLPDRPHFADLESDLAGHDGQ